MASLPLRSKKDLFILTDMAELKMKYRGRIVTEDHLFYIRELIAAHPGASRRTLSKKLCEAWQWRQANGTLSDMICRGLLLRLERAGQIRLPPVKYVRHNPLAQRAAAHSAADRYHSDRRRAEHTRSTGVSVGAAHRG